MAAVDTPLLDPYISFLLAPRPMSQPTQQDTSPSLAPRPSAPALADLMNLPPHVTRLLLVLAPFIARMRWLAEVLSWSSPRTSESWLLLGAWWGLCLMTDYSIRYLLPFALLATLPQLKRAEPEPQPATEETLHETLEHVARIQTLVPRWPALPTYAPPLVLRVIATAWVPYVLFMHFVRIRALLALFGTVLITWRAPWARALRAIFLASAFWRHFSARVWAILSGTPLAQPSRPQPQPGADALSVQEDGPSVRFLFTIYENQRWWVGLDWTAALVPSERPSWCAANQQPVAPPSVFALPPTTTVYAPDGKGGRVKRTARWAWEEGEWKVVVRREVNGAPEVKRIEKQPLFVQEDTQSGSKLAMKLKNAVSSSSQDFGSSLPVDHKDGDAHAPAEREEYLTDPDGWTFFDNKWESASNKGGIGKFTRYRRWTRIAVLAETVEYVGPGELGVFKDNAAPTLQPVVAVNPAVATTGTAPPKDDRPTQDPGSPTSMTTESSTSSNSLRQRLKAAVHKS